MKDRLWEINHGFEWPEPDEAKVSSPVPRGVGLSDGPRLPDSKDRPTTFIPSGTITLPHARQRQRPERNLTLFSEELSANRGFADNTRLWRNPVLRDGPSPVRGNSYAGFRGGMAQQWAVPTRHEFQPWNRYP